LESPSWRQSTELAPPPAEPAAPARPPDAASPARPPDAEPPDAEPPDTEPPDAEPPLSSRPPFAAPPVAVAPPLAVASLADDVPQPLAQKSSNNAAPQRPNFTGCTHPTISLAPASSKRAELAGTDW